MMVALSAGPARFERLSLAVFTRALIQTPPARSKRDRAPPAPAPGVQLAKGRRRDKRERFVAAILDAVSIEPYDLEVAEAHALLLGLVRRVGTPRGAHDLIIAATARARKRQVVSLDRSGFAELPGVSRAGVFG